jgi:hypothetical protein
MHPMILSNFQNALFADFGADAALRNFPLAS